MKRNVQYLVSILLFLITAFFLSKCQKPNAPGTFGYDLEFLSNQKELILLKSQDNQQQVILVPDYQGRIMTSSARGKMGKSYGWINYDLVASGKFDEHINVFGGEDRFWLGPEGGQYSIFFKKDTEFTLDNWFTPAPFDTEPFEISEQSDSRAVFTKEMKLVNYQGFEFELSVNREVSLLNRSDIEKNLDITLGGQVAYVGFQSENTIRNDGITKWNREKGLLSIWILGMYIPSESTTVVIPYKDSLELNTRYFGEIGPDRLRVTDKTVFFKGDGKYRCKIGIPPLNATPYFGSYDAENEVLTIIEYTFKGDTTYVNSLWKYQEDPYAGDVINSYNDGPLENGDIMGPFYELESSSSARELDPGETMNHVHRTYHFEGSEEDLNEISENVLGVGIGEIVSVFQ